MPLSLDQDQVVRRPLLDLHDQNTPPHTPDYQESQAAKLHIALGEESPGIDQLASSFTTGNDQSYRRILAQRNVIQQQQVKNDILDSVLQSDPSAITPEVVSVVQGMSMSELRSPDLSDIIEREYAKKYVTTGAALLENDILDEAMATDPEKSNEILDRSEVFAYKQNYLNTMLDEAEKSVQDQSWLGTVYNLGENMIVGNYQTYNQVGSSAELDDLPALPGQNRLEGYAFLWGLSDPDEFKSYIDRIKDDLSARNPYAFREWFQGMMSFGNSDAALNTITAGMDLASLIPVGKLGSAMKTISKVSRANPTKMSEIAGAVGRTLDSGTGKIAEEMAEAVRNGTDVKDVFFGGIKNAKELENSIPNIMAPDAAMSGGTQLGKAAYTRLKDAILENGDLARRILDTNRIDTLTADEVLALRDDLSRQFMRDHPNVAKNVIDVESEVDVGNVYNAKIIIGHRDGSLFESEGQAKAYVTRYIKPLTNDYKVVQKGDSYQVEITKTLDESRAWDLRLDTTQTTPTSRSDISQTLSWLRSPIEQVSDQQRVARAVLTSSKEQIDNLFSEMTRSIGELSKRELSEVNDLMFVNQKSQKFYDTVSEFEEAFHDRFKKMPSEKQVEAYFGYTNVSDLDLAIRDLNWYKQKAMNGFEDIEIDIRVDRTPETTESWRQSFEGKVVDRLPYENPEPFKVAIIQNGKVTGTQYSATIGEKGRESIQKLLDEGYKIINAVNSDFNIDGKYYDYVVSKNFRRSRVGVKNIDRKPGGHKIVRYPWYVKQGKVSGEGSYYRGDMTLFNARTEGEAKKFVDTLEVWRQKMVRNEPDAMKFARDNLPISTRELMAAVTDKTIDITVPFTVTRSGSRTIDTAAYKGLNLRDMTKSEHKPGDRLLGRFGGERSETDIGIVKSESDVKFLVEDAPYLSPLEAMKSASSDMISTHLFNDYKIMSMKNFIREFSDVLDGSLNELKSQGLSVIQDPKFTLQAEQSPELSAKVQRARNVSRAFNLLMDNSDAVSRKVDLIKEKIVSPIIPKMGPRGEEWLSENMLAKTKNPASFFKSLAFHTKMGFWNPTQYFKQANSVVNVVSVGGVNGLKSSIAYPFMRGVLWNGSKEILEASGRKVEALGLMKKDEFVELMNLYKKSGFNEIGGDVAYLDDLRSPELVESKTKRGIQKALKTSATPFYEGERMSRLAAWGTAYLEKKAALKGAKITRRDEADILYRAKTLVGNMTREGNAAWQKGYSSVITQFFGYQARIMDQLLGKQLTGAERARLFLGYSAMYGLPVSVGAGVGVFPVRDWLMDTMYEQGMDPQDPLLQPFMDGLVTTMTDFMIGKEWNISSSYGPGGLPTFYDLFRGDKGLSDLLMGASGGIGFEAGKSLWSSAWNGATALLSETNDFDGGLYNLAKEDFVKALRNITTVDSAAKLYHVYNFGTWASKNGFDITKMDLPDAIMAAVTGLQPEEIERSYSKLSASRALKDEREEAKKDLINRLRDARKLESSATRESLIRGIKVDMELWGFTPSEKAQISRYAADSKTLEDISLEQYDKEMERKSRSVTPEE